MKFLTAAAALALFASPALAQTAAPTVGNNNSQAQAAGEASSMKGSGQAAGVMADEGKAMSGSTMSTDGMSTSSTTANPPVVPKAGVPSTGASTAASGTPGASTDEATSPSGGAVPGQTPN